MKRILVMFIIMVLVGCVDSPKPRWYKAGVSPAETHNQHAECIYNVGINKVDITRENQLIEACMISKGFRWGIPNSY